MERVKEEVKNKIFKLLAKFINEYHLKEIEEGYFFIENPKKRIIWIVPQKIEELGEGILAEEFVNKVGIKFASYTKSGFFRLKTGGFQWLGKRIDKNFLSLDSLDKASLEEGVPIKETFPYPEQVVLVWRSLPIGWGHIKGGILYPKIPKPILSSLKNL